MHSESLLRTAIEHDLHGFSRVNVLSFHEPPWFVGAYRQQGDIRWAIPLANASENLAIAITRVTGDIHIAGQ